MTIRNVGFIGIRTSMLRETTELFRDCLEVPVTLDTASKMRFEIGDETTLELYGPEDRFHAFFNTGPVVGLKVSNFGISKQRMVDYGVIFIGNPQHGDGMSWQHFYLPDGTIAEIIGLSLT